MAVQPLEVQEWTTEEIYDMASKMLKARHGIGSIDEFVKGYRAKEHDTCEFIEIVGLLSLLPEDDEYYIGSERAA